MKTKKTILLVEDEAILGMTGKMTLEKQGYGIIIAVSGEKAVETFRNKKEIDLVLMDIDLGKGIDGTEAARQILQIRHVPIVFLSSHTEPEIVEKTEKITSYGYVVKNSGNTVLDASIKMAFKLFDANRVIGESEERQRAMISNISDVIVIVDMHGIVKYASPNIEKWFGWTVTELIGFNSWKAVRPEEVPRLKQEIYSLMEKHDASYTCEFSFICKDGSYRPVELTAINLSKNEFIQGILLNYHDISERKKVETDLTKKMNELQEFHRLTVDRELMMIELKKEINNLLVQTGKPEKYRIVK